MGIAEFIEIFGVKLLEHFAWLSDILNNVNLNGSLTTRFFSTLLLFLVIYEVILRLAIRHCIFDDAQIGWMLAT